MLRGVGDAAAGDLAELGITSVLDLVTHYPRRYIDGTRMVTIDRLAEGEKATVLATVRRVSAPPARGGRGRRGPARVQLDIADGGGRAPGGLLQPGVAGAPAAGRHPGPVLRTGHLVPG